MNHESLDARLEQYDRFGVKLGLDNISAVCAALGYPQRAAPAIHIAGTNGKGSTTAALCAMLRAANYPTGRYTSPHLCNVTERIAVDDVPVTATALGRAIDAVDRAAEQAGCTGVTYFEVLTAAAFYIFKARFVDAAVYEVGLGGRLDATNVLEPEVVCITTIAQDHTAHLGEGPATIAAEKAGIMKPGVPVVCGPLVPEALEVVRRCAADQDAPLRVYGEHFGLREERTTLTDGWQTATWWGRGHAEFPFRLPLRGAWQMQNAACALAIAHELVSRGWNLKPTALRTGLEHLRWPGRLEWLSRTPPVLFDCAHNPAAVAAVADTVAQDQPAGVLPVLAVLQGKDAGGMCAALARLGPEVIVTTSDHPRALAPDALATIARGHFAEVHMTATLTDALERAAQVAGGRPAFVVGSTMNYAETRHALTPFATG